MPGAQAADHALGAGWRLFSVPEKYAADANLGNLLPETCTVFTMQNGFPVKVDPGDVEPGRGYWLYLPEPAALHLDEPDTWQERPFSVALTAGWNMIGVPLATTALPGEALRVAGRTAVDAPQLRPGIYFYNPSTKEYEPATVLEPWTAYFVYAREETTLTFTPPDAEGGDGFYILPFDAQSIVVGSEAGVPAYVQGQMLVAMDPALSAEDAAAALRAAGFEPAGVEILAGIYQVSLPQGMSEAAAAAALDEVPGAQGAAPNYVLSALVLPDDPVFAIANSPVAGGDNSQYYAYEVIGMAGAWGVYEEPGRPLVAVVDTGVDASHPELAGRVLSGRDFVSGGVSLDTSDGNGHGTQVAGVIAGQGGNAQGGAGMCWNCRILPVKVCNARGQCPLFSVISGIGYAAAMRAPVINISLGASFPADSEAADMFNAALDVARARGLTVIAAAGNNNADAGTFLPAALPGVISVAATDSDDNRAAFSNFGASVDLAAPGKDIYTTDTGGGYKTVGGTSLSAAFVSGLAGEMMSAMPDITASEIENTLRGTGVAVAADQPVGVRIDAGRALQALDTVRVVRPAGTNRVPDITGVTASPAVAPPGAAIVLRADASDPDGDTLSFEWTAPAGTLKYENAREALWDTAGLDPGDYSLLVHVSDAYGATVHESVTVTLAGASQRLEIEPLDPFTPITETFTFRAWLIEADGTRTQVAAQWESGDAAIGAIDAHGVFTPAGASGRAPITARFGGLTAGASIETGDPVSSPWAGEQALELPDAGAMLGTVSGGTWSWTENSAFMIGAVVVNVVFMESNGSIDPNQFNWTTAQKDQAYAEIKTGLDWWVAQEPNAYLSFNILPYETFSTGYEPTTRQSAQDYLFVSQYLASKGYSAVYSANPRTNAVYNNRKFADDMRTQYKLDWAFTIYVVTGNSKFTDGRFAYAWLGGSSIMMTYQNDGWGINNMDKVTAHEAGHIFRALDQYSGACTNCTDLGGYLQGVNSNCVTCSNAPSIMKGNSWIADPTVRVQIGWRDSDGDGVLDPVDPDWGGSSSFTLSPAAATVASGSTVDMTATLINFKGDTIPAATVTFTTTAGSIAPTPVRTWLPGEATTTLTTVCATHTVTAATPGVADVTSTIIGTCASGVTPPTNLVATANCPNVDLTWTAAAPGTYDRYTVKRATVSGGPYATVTTGITTTSYTDPNPGGGVYYYVVTAYKSANPLDATSASNEANVTLSCGGTPPATLTATANCPDVDLAWSAATPGTYNRYTVKRAAVSGGPYATITTGVSTTSYTDPNPGNGTYYYVVVAYKSTNPLDATSASGEASATLNCSSATGTCIVSSNANAGANTLRQCIIDANANPGPDTIQFDPVMAGQTITLVSALPSLTDDETTINNTTGGEVVVNGNNSNFHCFTIESATNTIRGMTVLDCGANYAGYPGKAGIAVTGIGASGNIIAGNYIGTNMAGATNRGNMYGVLIYDAPDNVIGGSIAADRNIISANLRHGIMIFDMPGSVDNVIRGNYIGTDPSGTIGISTKQTPGLFIEGKRNIIGGSVAGQSNVISGNTGLYGGYAGAIYLKGAGEHKVIGNYIGTDPTGTQPIPNEWGIQIFSPENIIGGSNANEGNIFGPSNFVAIYIASARNKVLGNNIGTDPTGSLIYINNIFGIQISGGVGYDARWNQIGGSNPGEANIIANAGQDGVAISGHNTVFANYNLIAHNKIYNNTDQGISRVLGGNDMIPRPVIVNVTNNGANYDISGAVICPAYPCTVELFRADDSAAGVIADAGGGEGYAYLTSTTVAAGAAFSFTNVSISSNSTKVSATVTDADGNTSEFSNNGDLPPTPVTNGAACDLNWPTYHCNNHNTGVSNAKVDLPLGLVWKRATTGALRAMPAVNNDRVFIGTLQRMYALNKATGALLWQYPTGSYTYTAAVASGTVYFTSMDFKVYAVNETTGALIWSYTSGNQIYGSPTVENGRVFFTSADRKVYALDASTGAFLWSYTTGGIVSSTPAVADGLVFIGSDDNKVYALNQITGAKVWEYTTGGIVNAGSPTVANGTVYVGSIDNKVYALDELTGAKKWEFITFDDVRSTPAVVNGRVYVGSNDNRLYALNETTGLKVWEFYAGGDVYSSPAVVDGKVIVGSTNNKMYVLDETTGAKLWEYTTGGQIYSSPAVAGGMVFIGSNDSYVYAFEHVTPTPPVATATVLCPNVSLSWSAAAPAEYNRYTVKRASVSGGPYATLTTNLSVTNYVDMAPGNGTYYYMIVAYQSAMPYYDTAGAEIAVTVNCVASNIVPAPCGTSWPDYMCNGENSGEGSSTTAAPPFKVKWKKPLAESWSSVSVKDGIAVTTSRNGLVSAYNADNGTLLWSRMAGTAYRDNTPAIGNGIVYVVPNSGGIMYALNINTGATVWQKNVGTASGASPVTDGTNVYVAASGLYVLDALTGATVWTGSASNDAAPAITSDRVFVVSGGTIRCYDKSTGALIWTSPYLGSIGGSSPVLWKNRVFVGASSSVKALNIDTGAIVWTHSLGTDPVDSTAAIANGVLFIGGANGYVFAVDAQTGTRKWETSVTTISSGNCPPAITTANGYVYSGMWASSGTRNFTVLNASTGAIEWTYPIGSLKSYSAASIVNDIVYITTDGGTGAEIIAFENDVATGTVTPPVATAVLNCPDADITWTAASPSSYDRYTVYRASTSGGPYVQIATGLSTLSYTDSMPGQGLYYYVVEGYKSSSTSEKTGYSNEVYVDVDCDVILSVGGQCTPILTWNPSGAPGMDRYTVRRSATSGGPWTDVGTNITATTWQDTGTADNTTYYYTVVAYRSTDTTKKSDPSNEVTMTTDCAPFDVEALAMCPDVLVTWTASNSPVFNRFTVFRSTTSGGPWTQIATGLSNTSYTDTPPLSSGQTYYYVVQGYENGNSSNKSDYSPEAFVSNFTCPYPEPQNLVAALKCPDIELTWNSVTEATGYHIYRASVSGGPYTLLEQEVTSPYLDTTAATGSTYFYVVTAFYSSMAGQESGYSNEASITKSCGTNKPYTYDYDCGNRIPPHFSAPTPDGELYRPWEVTTDPAGNMYVSNSINNRIEKYDKDCNFIRKWGAPGNYPGQMTEPRGIVYNPSDGLIYVTDAYERVQAFTTDGAYSHGWSVPKAVSLAADGAGSIYVVQHKLLGYLAKYDTTGMPLAQWYMPNILGVGVDPTSGTVYVTTNTAIQALDSNGAVTATVGAGQVANPAGIHFSPDGRMFVSDTGARQVFIFQGGLLLDTVGQGGLAAGEFTQPTDVWAVDDKKILVLDRQHDRVNIFTQK